MSRRVALVALVVFMLTGGTVGLGAHEGHLHKILGTVTMAAPDHVMLKDTKGKDATVQVDGKTKVRQGGKAAEVGDIKEGMRVVIAAATVKENGVEKLVARTIDVAAAQSRK